MVSESYLLGTTGDDDSNALLTNPVKMSDNVDGSDLQYTWAIVAEDDTEEMIDLTTYKFPVSTTPSGRAIKVYAKDKVGNVFGETQWSQGVVFQIENGITFGCASDIVRRVSSNPFDSKLVAPVYDTLTFQFKLNLAQPPLRSAAPVRVTFADVESTSASFDAQFELYTYTLVFAADAPLEIGTDLDYAIYADSWKFAGIRVVTTGSTRLKFGRSVHL